jgi:hypothetical protein
MPTEQIFECTRSMSHMGGIRERKRHAGRDHCGRRHDDGGMEVEGGMTEGWRCKAA